MVPNKTDANDADGLAQLAEVGFFREVRVKGFDSMLTRTLVTARRQLVRITTALSNQIRGFMKTFGLVVPAGKGSNFERNVRLLLADHPGLSEIMLPLLEAWRTTRLPSAELGRQLVAQTRQGKACQLLMSIPGVGAITATAFVTALEKTPTTSEGPLCRGLAGPDHPAIPIRRSRLRWSHIPARRPPCEKPSL
jgi:transposase